MTARCTLTSWDSVPDDVRETQNHDNRMAELDAKAEWIAAGCPSADEWFADELLAMAEPIEDPSNYASEAEYYDLGGLLTESCGPVLDDDLPGVLDPAVASELRARIRKAAA